MTMKNKKAFTLIEVLVSLLLLAITLAGGITLYFNASTIMGLAMHKKIVTEMANQTMEQVKQAGYGSLPNPATGVWSPAFPVNFNDFKAEAQRRVTDVPSSTLKEVEVKVCWPDCGAGTTDKKIITLATYMAP